MKKIKRPDCLSILIVIIMTMAAMLLFSSCKTHEVFTHEMESMVPFEYICVNKKNDRIEKFVAKRIDNKLQKLNPGHARRIIHGKYEIYIQVFDKEAILPRWEKYDIHYEYEF